MKRALALILSLLALLFGAAFAQKTPADTSIQNIARASYVDSSGQTQTAESNPVVTVVQKVYSLTITPNATDVNGNATTTESAVTSFGQTKQGLVGSELFFYYTVTNTSNTKTGEKDLIDLLGVQGTADNFDFDVLELYQVPSANTPPANGAPTIAGVSLGADEVAYIAVKVRIPTTGVTNNQVGNLNLDGFFDAKPTVSDADNWAQATAKTRPNVTLTKTTTKTDIVPNDTVPYVLSGQNTGGTAAYAVTNVVTVDGVAKTGLLVTDVIPNGLSYVAGSASGTASAGTASVIYATGPAGSLTWTATQPASGVSAVGLLIEGTGQFFPANATHSLNFSAKVPANAAAGTAYANDATLKYDANGDGDADDPGETFTTPKVTSAVGTVRGVAVGPQGKPSAAEGGDALSGTGTYTDPDTGKTWTYTFSGSHSAKTDTQTVTNAVYTGDTVAFVNTIKNPGNATDTYTLTTTNSAGYTVTLYTVNPDNSLTLLNPKEVNVAAGASLNVVVKVNVPAGGAANTVTLTAARKDAATVSDVTTNAVPAPQAGFSVDLAANSDGVQGGQAGDGNPNPNPDNDTPAPVTTNPGTTVNFPLEVANTGQQSDSFALSVPTTLPTGWSVVFRVDDNCDGVPGTAETSGTGTIAVGALKCYIAVVTVPAGAPPATQPLTFAVTSDKDPTRSSDTVSTTVTVNEVTNFSFTPNYDNIQNPGKNVTYSGEVVYTHTLTNSGNTNATVNVAPTSSPNGWTYAYSVDGGANYSASVGNLTVPAGGSRSLLVRVTVPAPSPFDARVGQTETATITAVASYANAPSVSKNVTDVTTVVGGSLSLVKSAATFDGAQPAPTTCSSAVNRVDATGAQANPGDFLCYTIVADNKGNSPLTQVVVRDALSGFTTFVSVSAVGAGYGTGSKVLYSNNGTTWSGSLSSLAAGETVYVAVDTNGDNTITSADTTPPGATLTVTFVVRVK